MSSHTMELKEIGRLQNGNRYKKDKSKYEPNDRPKK